MTTTTEIWRTPIYKGETYENYQVSNLGQILSLNFRNTGKPELMNPWEDKDGYLKIALIKNRKKDFMLVHRLIAETFIPNPDNLPQINHKDENKANNSVENLEWCDGKYNHNYGTINQRISKANTNGKLSKPVLQLSLTGELIREYPSIHECERNGFDKGCVCNCCNGKLKTHKGFRWEYK